MNNTENGSQALTSAAQESTRDLTKLLISLASAVVVLSATFTEKLSQGAGLAIIVLFVAWVFLALAVIYGVKALSTLVHAQRTAAEKWGEMTFPAMRLSWRSFQAGMVLLLLYAALAAGKQAWGASATKDRCCQCSGIATQQASINKDAPATSP
jgi:hypothetical protein